MSPFIRILASASVVVTALHMGEAAAEVYEVGPDEAYEAIGEVPWESLEPGDEVRIHWRQEPYREKWVIARHGTADQPIVVRGVAGPEGQRPVIDGRDATTRSQLNFWSENRGVIKIGGANIPASDSGSYIVIEGLDIRSAREPYSYTGRNGVADYNDNAAPIFIESGQHITIRDCVLRDSGNGLFAAHASADILVEGNHIYDNGVEGSIYEHNNYTEARGIVFQFNHFGPLREGCLGNNLKDRSAGTVVRYNLIESGNRQLDLVESGHYAGEAGYGDAYVYGNVLVEPDGAGNSQILHFGGDSGNTSNYRPGTLYFFHNTVISTRSGNTTLMRLSTNAQHADVRNNLVYVTGEGERLALVDSSGTVSLSGNWLKEGWVGAHGGLSGTIDGMDEQLSGASPLFSAEAAGDFRLLPESPCRDVGGPLAEVLGTEHVVDSEFSLPAGAPRADDGAPDIGAFEYTSAPPPGSDAGPGFSIDGGIVGGDGGGAGADEEASAGCAGCRAGGGPAAGAWALVLLAVLGVGRRRLRPITRRRSCG